jgi:uncharacterized protein (DUF362 family)
MLQTIRAHNERGNSQVILKDGSNYKAYLAQGEDVHQTLPEGLEFINWKKLIGRDDHVFVKPNFTFPCYKEGVTTSPAVLIKLLTILADRASKVTIVESNGGNNIFTAEEAFKGHGIQDVCKDLGVEMINLSKEPTQFISEKVCGKTVKVEVPKLLQTQVDRFVSVPVLKVHAMTSVTISMKNLWGCYPDPMRCLYHDNLDRKLALLTKLWQPSICVVDGIYALDGHGPMFGTPVNLNLLAVVNNPVVADALGARIMGFKPRTIDHVRVAEDFGLGSTSPEDVMVNINWKALRHSFSFERTIIDYLSLLPFHSGLLAKIIFQSPFTSGIRRAVDIFRTPDEKADLRSYIL